MLFWHHPLWWQVSHPLDSVKACQFSKSARQDQNAPRLRRIPVHRRSQRKFLLAWWNNTLIVATHEPSRVERPCTRPDGLTLVVRLGCVRSEDPILARCPRTRDAVRNAVDGGTPSQPPAAEVIDVVRRPKRAAVQRAPGGGPRCRRANLRCRRGGTGPHKGTTADPTTPAAVGPG